MRGGGFDVSPRAQVDGWLVQISRERVERDSASSRCDLSKLIGRLVVTSGGVDELEAVEFVLESMYLLAVCLHLWIVAAQDLHYLVDDELGVSSDVEAPNP